MIEKVNPEHPDKISDCIAGAIVDLVYKKENEPKIAVEVLIGHGVCHAIIETTVKFDNKEIEEIIKRIAGDVKCDIIVVKQDEHLSKNQEDEIRCGDNGIFNPPYQETLDDGNKTYSPPIYHKFIEESYLISKVVELIHPARFLFNAGSTPKDWNKKC